MNKEPIVIIGAGWAGLSAAVRLTQQGQRVVVYESAKQVGGRARAVSFRDNHVDNGQHIMIGAYRETLALMQTVGIDINTALKRLPLRLTVFDKNSKNPLRLKAPRLPAPLHLLVALLTAKGLNLKDRVAAVRFGLYLKKINYLLQQDVSVEALFIKTRQTNRLIKQLWEPLVLSTMNTAIDTASANVFMRVFKDAFTHKRSDAELLIPTVDLSKVFPDGAVQYIEANGGEIHLKARVESIHVKDNKITSISVNTGKDVIETIQTSKVIIATAPQNILKLIQNESHLANISEQVSKFDYEPIVTVYLQYQQDAKLIEPMMGLSNTLSQWLFDRGEFCLQPGLISVVISASGEHMQLNDDKLTLTVHDEISRYFTVIPKLEDAFVIREKRATFACHLNINEHRPSNRTPVNGLYIAGDYTDTAYPATLEGAVRSGCAAAKLIEQN